MYEFTLNGSKKAIELPRVLFELSNFFFENPTLFDVSNVFRRNGSPTVLEALNLHLVFRDYRFMSVLKKNPHEVATFYKDFLRSLNEPVCTDALYPSFMSITQEKYKKR